MRNSSKNGIILNTQKKVLRKHTKKNGRLNLVITAPCFFETPLVSSPLSLNLKLVHSWQTFAGRRSHDLCKDVVIAIFVAKSMTFTCRS